jgi:hypothetical protein
MSPTLSDDAAFFADGSSLLALSYLFFNLFFNLFNLNTHSPGLFFRPADAPRPPRRERREAARLDDAPGREVHEGKNI